MRTLVRGEVLESMCVIDENPHPRQPCELAALRLARSVGSEVNLRDSLAKAPESLLVAETLAASARQARSPGPAACARPGRGRLT
jgi:hypothetical protein